MSASSSLIAGNADFKASLAVHEGTLRDLGAMVSSPNAVTHLSAIKDHVADAFTKLYSNYKKIHLFVENGSACDQILTNMQEIVDYKTSSGNFTNRTIVDVRVGYNSVLASFEKLVKMIENGGGALEENMNKVKEKIADLTYQWGLVKKHYADMSKVGADSEYLSQKLQDRLLRVLDVLNKIESRINKIQSISPSSYGCIKTIELVEKERKYTTGISESIKKSIGGPSGVVAAINKQMESNDYVDEIASTWRKFMVIRSGTAPSVSDVAIYYNIP